MRTGTDTPLPSIANATFEMENILIFRETILPASETFIKAQAGALRSFAPKYIGLTPATRGLDVGADPILLRPDRSLMSRGIARLYGTMGIAPNFHGRAAAARPALIHAHFAPDGASALSLEAHLKVPLLVNLHGYDVTVYDRYRAKSVAGNQYMHRRKTLWDRAMLFVCASNFLRQTALELGFPKDKLRVHYIGIDRSAFTPAVKPDKNLVLFIGRLVPKKGVSHLLRAMRIVQQTAPDTELVIIGSGPLDTELRTLANELKVNCQFLGGQPSSEVRNWLQRASLLCIPSVRAENGDSEGLGMVILEAQATGRPVVGFRTGGIPEAVLHGKTGLLAEPGNAEELAQHILRFGAEDSLWTGASASAVQWVQERFDLNTQTRELEEIYRSCLR